MTFETRKSFYALRTRTQ